MKQTTAGNTLMNSMKIKPIFIIGVLFFVFGFISWINAILIPYFQIVCELSSLQSMMVAFAFYISYFVMAIPSSYLLNKTGFKNGMIIGLLIMAAGAIIFIPAAMTSTYSLFLTGLFIQATGLTILQSAANPYVTILGPIESAAKRISIMGVCSKVAGAIAPIILIRAITNNPDEIDQLKQQLIVATADVKSTILDQLGGRLIIPYMFLAVSFFALGFLIKAAHLPDVEISEEDLVLQNEGESKTSILQYPYLLLGAFAVFCAVSVEVLSVDSIINYAQYQGYSFREAKFFATYTLIIMILSYLAGIVLIPKFIQQRKVLQLCAIAGLVISCCVMLFAGKSSVWLLSLLGLSNALLWPTIWPLAIDGLGKFTKQGSALLIMGVAGGALFPLFYGFFSDHFNPQTAYWILIPCYGFILYYATRGYRIGKENKLLVNKGL